jgi:hypothetical protein
MNSDLKINQKRANKKKNKYREKGEESVATWVYKLPQIHTKLSKKARMVQNIQLNGRLKGRRT